MHLRNTREAGVAGKSDLGAGGKRRGRKRLGECQWPGPDGLVFYYKCDGSHRRMLSKAVT